MVDARRVLTRAFVKAMWKRRVSIFRRTGKLDKAVNELSQYLDTFYTDVEGWLELADIYATCCQYVASVGCKLILTRWVDTTIRCNH